MLHIFWKSMHDGQSLKLLQPAESFVTHDKAQPGQAQQARRLSRSLAHMFVRHCASCKLDTYFMRSECLLECNMRQCLVS